MTIPPQKIVTSKPDEPKTYHFAIVVPDLKSYRAMRESCWMIKPHDIQGNVMIHVLLQDKRTEQDILFSYTLTELGLVKPEIAKLRYPEELELGGQEGTA